MQRQRRTGTAPELALRRELWSRGLRYRVDFPIVGRRRRVDVAFTHAKVAVFVDGCFWHGCPVHGTMPKNNREWWQAKLEANARRDLDTDDALAKAGWTTVRIWEHEEPGVAAANVAELLANRNRTLQVARSRVAGGRAVRARPA